MFMNAGLSVFGRERDMASDMHGRLHMEAGAHNATREVLRSNENELFWE